MYDPGLSERGDQVSCSAGRRDLDQHRRSWIGRDSPMGPDVHLLFGAGDGLHPRRVLDRPQRGIERGMAPISRPFPALGSEAS